MPERTAPRPADLPPIPRFVSEAELPALTPQQTSRGNRCAHYAFNGITGFALVWLESGEIVAVLHYIEAGKLTDAQRAEIAAAYAKAQTQPATLQPLAAA